MADRRKRGRRPAGRLTARRRNVFLSTLRGSANVSAAIRAAGLSRTMIYRHRRDDALFREDWDAALEEALDDLEEALRRRAIEGVLQPVYYGGKQCGAVTRYSDQLGIFLLKYRRPEAAARVAAAADTAAAKTRLAVLLDQMAGDGGEEEKSGGVDS